MPREIGNTKVYTRKEVEKATLFGQNTVLGLFKEGEIKARKTSQGYYEVLHEDLKSYLIEQQNVPEDTVNRIIEYRLEHNNSGKNLAEANQ